MGDVDSRRRFSKVVWNIETNQREVASNQQDHKDNQHHQDPQKQASSTVPLLPHIPEDKARGPTKTVPPTLGH